ncbi:MAG: MarR family winged helix-turn-helix transcriptional regulator, partial [Candidatus Promineifilaceae bacterium]
MKNIQKYQSIRSEVGRTIGAFAPFYQENIVRLNQKFDPPNGWFLLNWVRASEPQSFNLQEMTGVVGPYSAPEATLERFQGLVEHGFADKDEYGALTLTDKGRAIIEGFFDGAHEALSEIEPLNKADMTDLANLLGRLLKAVAKGSEPASKPYLTNSRWTDPGKSAPPSVRIDQFATDLYRFRDDAHIAAWKSYGVSGQVWETLTYVWRDEANTAEELAERLSFRGYSTEDYEAALEKLIIKGWIESVDGKYCVTPAGRRIREEAEEKTDALYFASWSKLSKSERRRLKKLITRLNKKLETLGQKVIWEQALAVAQGVIPVTREVVNPLFEEYFEEPRFFYPTLLATGTAPEPYSVENHLKINPYTAAKQLQQNLDDIAAAGLMSNGASKYIISDRGREAIDTVNDAFYKKLGDLPVLTDEELTEVSEFLARLVDASLAADEPSEKIATEIMHGVHTETEYPPLAKIDMHLDDLRSFRDDAHIASWKPYDIDGRTWETLS